LFTEYQQKVAAFPAELEEAVKKAREEGIKDTSQKAKIEADLFEKEWEATKQSYDLKIQSLEETIKKQTEQLESISTQLQTTLKQAQDLAMRAFGNSAAK
jgi:predicted  nucleic acid-binding Zn-ribbon protein